MTTFPTLPPPFDGPPALVEARGLARAWFTVPGGVVTQVADGATMDADIVRWLMTDLTRALRARQSDPPRFRFVHDWRGVVRHEAEARRLVVEWGLSFPRGEIVRIDLLPPPAGSSLLSMAVATGRLALLAAGVRLDIVSDPKVALEDLTLDVRA